MKFTLTDKLHISIGLNILFIIWFGLEWIDPSINGIWFGLLGAIVFGFFKELNDKYGWIKWLLTDKENTTGMNGRDILMTVTLPALITMGHYILYK